MRPWHWTLLILGGLAVVYACPPLESSFYPLCPVKSLTGFACPGCGSTRALHALLHFRFAEAWSLNPLFTCAAPAALLSFGLNRLRVR